MLHKARNLSAPGTWFLTVRLAEVGIIALLVGAVLEARYAWQIGAQFYGNGSVDAPTNPSLMKRITGMALFGGYRMPMSLLVIVLTLAALVVVLHRCQPVSHTRVLRWEWLVLWGASTLLAAAAAAVGVVALFAENPFASPDPSVVSGTAPGPGYHEQVVGNLSWPLGALLLLLPLGLWWARLPDADDLDDALTQADGDQLEGVGGPEAPAAVTATEGQHAQREADRDAIVLDDVEQIAPVERLQPRGDLRGDGSSSSGYDGYFRH
ncbi:hypothetical protein ABEG17_01575 [Pedococcus sp. KACC 23699]|uniref:Uncharacterized protein n=1 Tax=Pedococcus sp. KACC 23699 TaxID=3149228 RepID=A0AAU7JV42_9MICO